MQSMTSKDLEAFLLDWRAIGHFLFGTVLYMQDERRPTKVTLTNTGQQRATFCVVHQASRQWWGQPDGFDAGLPDWLDAFPVHGCLAPQVTPPCNP